MSPLPARGRSRAVLSTLILLVADGCGVLGVGTEQAGSPSPTTTVPLIVVRSPAIVANAAETPKAGECRRDGSPAVKERGYDAQRPTPCDQPHGLETWKVAQLPERWRALKHLPLGDGTVEDELGDALDQLCPQAELDLFLGLPVVPDRLGTLHQPSGITGFTFLPTPWQWQGGARWVRCDAGFRWDGDLTVSLTAARRAGAPPNPRSEATAALCVDRDEYYVACTQPHLQEVVAHFADVTTGRPDEGTDRPAYDQWMRRCSDAILETLGIARRAVDAAPETIVKFDFPSAADWAGGDRWVRCGLSFAVSADLDDLRETVGSARALGAEVPEAVR
jgi:hypothetical protein